MGESEIQSTTALQLGVSGVFTSSLIGHSVPDSIALLVAPDIVCFGQKEHYNDEDINAQENTIAAAILGLVVV